MELGGPMLVLGCLGLGDVSFDVAEQGELPVGLDSVAAEEIAEAGIGVGPFSKVGPVAMNVDLGVGLRDWDGDLGAVGVKADGSSNVTEGRV